MACPKKKTSESKRDHRRAHWRKQAEKQAALALSIGKSVLSGKSNSFVFIEKEVAEEEEE
jgi:large subunit ribosomal protein L32